MPTCKRTGCATAKLRAERVVRDRDEMDQVSQLLQRAGTERAKKLVASKSRPDLRPRQQMRRTMPNLSPQKRIRPGAAGKDSGGSGAARPGPAAKQSLSVCEPCLLRLHTAPSL